MIDPKLVIFAIEAGIKLGRKVYDVLVDETREAPLFLPLGTSIGDPRLPDATRFFESDEYIALIASGGPYAGLSGDRLVAAYLTVQEINKQLGGGSTTPPETVEVLQNLHGFKVEQVKKGFGAKHPAQRILGTIVEIGIDYFVANPESIVKDSSARKIVEAFVRGLDDVNFAEGDAAEIVREVIGDTLVAGLNVLGDHASLISDDKRVRALIGGVTTALKEELEKPASQGERLRAEDLFRRITTSILRGGAGAVATNVDLFIRGDGEAKQLVRSTVMQLLEAIRDSEDLFTGDTLERLVKSALGAVSENAELFSKKKLVQEIIKQTVGALTKVEGKKLFSAASVALIAREALEVVSENSETLIVPDNPQRQLIAEAVEAMAYGLASDLAGGAGVKSLLSTSQLIDMTKIIFSAVATHPEKLLGSPGDVRKSPLAQILGSVAGALAEDPTKLVNGQTFVELAESALRAGVQNVDKLLNLDSENPRTNLLYTVLKDLSGAALGGVDRRHLFDRVVFLETARRLLPTVSANLGPFLEDDAHPVRVVVEAVLQLANDTLQNQINGANLPVLVEGMLRGALLRDFGLDDPPAVKQAAERLLRVTV